MTSGDLLAILALLISVASAIYAHASVKAAQTANKIGLHEPRKAIYDGLLQFRSLFRGLDAHPTDEEIDSFYITSVAPSQVYLEPQLSERIHTIYKKSWELFRMIEIAESGDRPEMSKWDYINPFQELGRTELEDVIRDVTDRIHVGRT